MAINTLRLQIERDEGLRLKPYLDSVGKCTIGYGRNLDDRGISAAEARLMLDADLAETILAVSQALPWVATLDEPRRAVLINMAYNLGIAGLLGFRRALAAMQRGDWPEAAKEMLTSTWAEQVGPRAHRLAKQMAEGVWI